MRERERENVSGFAFDPDAHGETTSLAGQITDEPLPPTSATIPFYHMREYLNCNRQCANFGTDRFLHSTIIIAIYLLTSSPIQIDGNEGFSLLAFRSKVVIDPFDSSRNWEPRDDDPCKWNGVQCEYGRVETLNLQGLKLGRPLTPEIGKLAHLKALLVLSANNFPGAIPNEFGGLLMLELLDLRSNKELEIRDLPSLKSLLIDNHNSFHY